MKFLRNKFILITMSTLLFYSCNNNNSVRNNDLALNSSNEFSTVEFPKEFNDYWYSGKAEINRYELKQSRYGEIHEGDAVLIFVTEDFLTDSQVKYEGGEIDEDKTSVLKLNFTRKFNTGIYPYSMMSSIFTPVNLENSTLKVTTSNQEWCGHTFTQLNHRGNNYEVQNFSYFMNEGDEDLSLKASLLEDEIWNRIRINPESLPTGNIELIPSTQFLRLKHKEFKIENAVAQLEAVKEDSTSSKPLSKYTVDYIDLNRKLSITFETDFPHAILSWSETGDGNLTTTAKRTHVIKEPYWSQNSVADSTMRKKLGLK